VPSTFRLQCVAVCCVCCSVLQSITVHYVISTLRCNTPQHTQHTATHAQHCNTRNTLQHTATHCKTLHLNVEAVCCSACCSMCFSDNHINAAEGTASVASTVSCSVLQCELQHAATQLIARININTRNTP